MTKDILSVNKQLLAQLRKLGIPFETATLLSRLAYTVRQWHLYRCGYPGWIDKDSSGNWLWSWHSPYTGAAHTLPIPAKQSIAIHHMLELASYFPRAEQLTDKLFRSLCS